MINKFAFSFLNFFSVLKNVINTLFLSLRNKIIFITIFAVLFPMSLTGFYFYKSISNILQENISKELFHLVQQIDNDLISQLKMLDDTYKQILSNPVIRENTEIEAYQPDPFVQVRKKKYILDQLNYISSYNYLWNNKFLSSLFIFKDKDTYYSLSRETKPQTLDNGIKIFNDSANFSGDYLITPPTNNDRTIYYVRNLRNLESMDIQAKLILGINQDTLSNYYKTSLGFTNARLILFDNKQNVLFDTGVDNKKLNSTAFFNVIGSSPSINEIKVNNEVYLITTKKIQNYDLYFTIIFSKSSVYSKLSTSVRNYIFIFSGLLFISLLIAMFLSSRIIKPLSDLSRNISHVKEGNFNVKMPEYQEKELNQLSHAFNTMTDEIEYLVSEVYEKQLLLKEVELESLQNQMNPHFMFNVLETISWEARSINADKVYTMITSFGQFLRSNISMGSKEKITIKEEMQYIEFYLYLQKARFGDKLNINISIEDNAIKEFYIPKLCIQPLVENAIIHGLEGKRGKWNLDINLFTESVNIVVEVKDNGVGFNSDLLNLDDAQKSISLRKEGHTSIGLYNSNKRLKLFYGEEYGIPISSIVGEGTKATILLPKDKGDNHHV